MYLVRVARFNGNCSNEYSVLLNCHIPYMRNFNLLRESSDRASGHWLLHQMSPSPIISSVSVLVTCDIIPDPILNHESCKSFKHIIKFTYADKSTVLAHWSHE